MLTDKEKLAIVEKNLRKRRVSARQTASLMRQHERLTRKINGVGPGRPIKAQSPEEEYEYVFHQMVLRLEDERRAEPKHVGMTEGEAFAYLDGEGLTREEFEAYTHSKVKRLEQRFEANRVVPKASPAKQDPAGMTVADSETYLRSQHGRGVAVPANPTLEVRADVE